MPTFEKMDLKFKIEKKPIKCHPNKKIFSLKTITQNKMAPNQMNGSEPINQQNL